MTRTAIKSFVFKWFSGDPGDYCIPPGSEVKLEFGEMDGDKPMYVATTYNNHGAELWIGYAKAGWCFHCWEKDAHKLAWFILWNWWIVSTWCGIKRKLWYWSL